MNTPPREFHNLAMTDRIRRLKEATRQEERLFSIDQALIITESYRDHRGEPRVLQRAHALARALREMPLRVDPDEMIVGNRTPRIRAGVVSPEAGISWIEQELTTLESRPQDPFTVRPDDARRFTEEILPFWQGRTLEDAVKERLGQPMEAIRRVVKINQTDHAQGHICPDVPRWLSLGPRGIHQEASQRLQDAPEEEKPFLQAVMVVMEGAVDCITRYGQLADGTPPGRVCSALARRTPRSYHEALQSVWFLFVILQMESNASSFSPGRMDQYLLPFLEQDLHQETLTVPQALELTEALWIKFNQIVYMRNASSAEYFAGFPIGFNVAIGGMKRDGSDGTNILSWIFLKAQEHLGLPQPNLSARLWRGSPREFIDQCARVIGLGSGMPQIVNDESIIPALESLGISQSDARDYAVVGCVELSPSGNTLGWSDAAMFNLVKALELALNDGVCLLTGERLGPATGTLEDYPSFEALQEGFRRQIDYFMDRMIPLCDAVDRMHAEFLPSPFLSALVDSCLDTGKDVTAGGARYNLSGIQAIQVANVADSLAALKHLVYDTQQVPAAGVLRALREDFSGAEELRKNLISRAPKYGNDQEWVDRLGASWVEYFADRLKNFTNARGGAYQMGLYTVSAHVPMGKNVGATPDGRHAREPLADGGVSAMYGRDTAGPTALLRSLGRLPFSKAGNGALLNIKFLPRTFTNPEEREKFVALLYAMVLLGIHHLQCNVVDEKTLREAQARPDEHENLTIRVAGYTAYFVELAPDLQEEIIKRTTYGETPL
ncbi:formate C-acetyltransferase [Alkalispirochaeta americana]|uniref:Formate C-acetyltransferase n=1 Tax=Alkalispirochaeta americana TaxID=159291 RepID=A0A1N6QHC9_9SPIO|nr:formate C-acetyltransferase/glycerol dehydratase family glycyl radical enzyme [Alkalispirochaeta americana]SIQ16004.1 formate C-acetyltransferase [Alkalispirochaeta americana]